MYEDISLEQAWHLLCHHTSQLKPETLKVQTAMGRVVAKPVNASQDLPPLSQSAVDGYALGTGASDIGSTFTLRDNAAACSLESILQAGQAAAVDTGNPIPPGTVAVIPQEKVTLDHHSLRLLEKVKIGANIKRSGEDFVQGEALLEAGTRIDPTSLGVLAAFGIAEVETVCQPRVAIVCLAEDIVPWWDNPEPEQMRDSNGPMLTGLIAQSGGKIVSIQYQSQPGVNINSCLQEIIQEADLLIMVGGTYQNGVNTSRLLMESIGAQILYWGVPIQPGSHTGAGTVGNCIILSLSGNPAACAVGYHLFAAPLMGWMQGQSWTYQTIQARCTNGFPKKTGSRRFVRGKARFFETGWEVEVLPGQKPSMLRSLLDCNALIDLPAGSGPVDMGEPVAIHLLGNHKAVDFSAEVCHPNNVSLVSVTGGETY